MKKKKTTLGPTFRATLIVLLQGVQHNNSTFKPKGIKELLHIENTGDTTAFVTFIRNCSIPGYCVFEKVVKKFKDNC